MKKEILDGLKKTIKNYEILKDKDEFKEWVDIVFGPGLVGLDYSDIKKLFEGKTIEIIKIYGNIKEQQFPEMVIGIKIPKTEDLDFVHDIIGQIDENTKLLWQAVKHDGPVEIYVAYVREDVKNV